MFPSLRFSKHAVLAASAMLLFSGCLNLLWAQKNWKDRAERPHTASPRKPALRSSTKPSSTQLLKVARRIVQPKRKRSPTNNVPANNVPTNNVPSPVQVEEIIDLGDVAYKYQRYAQAEKFYQQAIKLNSQEASAHFRLGKVYAAQQRHAAAARAYERAFRLQPDFVLAQVRLDRTKHLSPPHAEATEPYNHLGESELDEDEAMAYYDMGLVYQAHQRYLKAIDNYKQAIRLDPTYAAAHYGLGVAYIMSNNKQAAVKQYQALKRLNPELAGNLLKEIVEAFSGQRYSQKSKVDTPDDAADKATSENTGAADQWDADAGDTNTSDTNISDTGISDPHTSAKETGHSRIPQPSRGRAGTGHSLNQHRRADANRDSQLRASGDAHDLFIVTHPKIGAAARTVKTKRAVPR